VSRERIAVVTTSYPDHPGDPSGHFVEAEVRALEIAGADVEVFALRGAPFGWPGVAAHVKEEPVLLLRAAHQIQRVSRQLSRNSLFSRVIAHWAIPSAFPISRTMTNVEVVSHGADVRLLVKLPRPLRHFLVDRILQNATTWRFPAEALQSDLAASLSSSLRSRVEAISKIVAPTLEAVVDRSAVDRMRIAQRKMANGQPVFAVAARLVLSKEVDRAIAFAAEQNATLFVIGDGPERQRLETLASTTRANAHFLGVLSRPDTLVRIAAADALVQASKTEGLSSVVREADLLGTRVIHI
jgi:teichuronic acid biosynthesis glycosyltransferase TuaC